MKTTATTSQPSFGNIMPQAIDAERVVLGAILGFADAWNEVTFLTPDMFYDYKHRDVFEAIRSMKQNDRPVDLITLTQEIAARGKIEQITPWFITNLLSSVVSDVHVVEHALIVQEKYLLRRLIKFAMQVQSKAFIGSEDVDDLLFEAGKEIEQLQEVLVGQKNESSYHEITRLFYDEMQQRMSRCNNNQLAGADTGLAALNRITSGWQPSNLIILAARPAMGKTTMAMHFAQSAAKAGIPVLVFSLEMSKLSLYQRSLLSESDGSINPANLNSGNLADELSNIDRAVSRISHLPIYVDDNGGISMESIRARCRLLNKQGKCGMAIIDYLQLVTPEKSRAANREQEIANMSRQAKIMARELNIPVILLSQLNRDLEKRQNKQPQLSDLRESGSIEQDADMVLFVHRPEYYGQAISDKRGNPIKNVGELIIAKYRNGPVGKVPFRHNETLTRIMEF